MSSQSHPSGSFELALRALGEEEGTSEQARALEQRLLDTLGAEALGAPVTTAGAAMGRWWLMLGVGLLIGMGALFSHPRPAPLPQAPAALVQPSPQSARGVDLAAERFVEPALVEPALVEPALVRPVPAPKPRSTRRGVRPVVAPRAHVSAQAPAAIQPPLESELSLLQRSRAALRRDPALALSLTVQHAHDYPAGMFVQEREVLAVEALLKQKRTADAIARAERFVTEQPDSTYAPRIRDMLAAKPRGVAARNAPEPLEPVGHAP